MTRDEILNMPAGREMDKLVSKKVLHLEDWIPFLSSDIGKAWEVVRKLKNKYSVSVSEDSKKERVGGKSYSSVVWVQEESTENYDGIVAHVYAETSPLAICRAALLTVMEEE